MDLRFDDRCVLITGGGAGIGYETAHLFALSGARVVVADIDPLAVDRAAEMLSAFGDEHRALITDVRKKGDIERLLSDIQSHSGRLDVLVNNVGHFVKPEPDFALTSDEYIENQYEINLKHVFNMTRAALPLLRASAPGSSIVNVSTIEASRGVPHLSVYSAFKAGVCAFARSLALDLGPEGIRVNTVSPETTESAQVAVRNQISPEYAEYVDKWLPLGRIGEPADTASCIVYLASDAASWITGVTINVDGGALAAGGWRRTGRGEWTNRPIVTAHGGGPGPSARMQ